MYNKKKMLIISFALSSLIVVGGTAFASPSEGSTSMGMMSGMMNGNGDGMMNMMNGNGMSNMMEAINSPEGQEMIDGCQDFISSYDDSEGTQQ